MGDSARQHLSDRSRGSTFATRVGTRKGAGQPKKKPARISSRIRKLALSSAVPLDSRKRMDELAAERYAQKWSIRYGSGLRNQISLPFNHSCKTCNHPNSYALESQDSTIRFDLIEPAPWNRGSSCPPRLSGFTTREGSSVGLQLPTRNANLKMP
jgi:hypothetical protein